MANETPSGSAIESLPIRVNSPVIACYPWQSSILETISLDAALGLKTMKVI